ncbi:MAG: hypothetical protein ACTHJH_10405 [Marmoricola sp.]
MSTKSVVDRLAGTAFAAVRHPLSSAGYVVGLAKGATEATVSLVRGQQDQEDRHGTSAGGSPTQSSQTQAQEARHDDVPEPERIVFGGQNKEAAPPQYPGGGGENFANNPSAETRDIAHGDRPADPHEVDSWTEDLDVGLGAPTLDIETPVGTVAADIGRNPDTDDVSLQQPDTEPLLDPSLTKSIKSESETLSKAADTEKD